MSTIARLERKLKREREQAPPAGTSDLGSAIEEIIRQQVEERVAEAVEKQRPLHNPRVPPYLREFTDKAPSNEFPPPVASTPAPKDMTILLHRDSNGRAQRASVGNISFVIERGADGRVIRMIQTEE